MENNNGANSTPKKVGGVLLDVLTIGMLFAAFAALFYSSFVLQSKTFPIGAMCAITAVGLLLLFFIGDVSCLSAKSKNNTLSVGFLSFSAFQLVALICNLALLLGLMIKLFNVEQLGTRLAYVITVSVILIGYVASVSYFSTTPEEYDGVSDDEDDEDSEEYDDLEEDDDGDDSDSDEADDVSDDDPDEASSEYVDIMGYRDDTQENL